MAGIERSYQSKEPFQKWILEAAATGHMFFERIFRPRRLAQIRMKQPSHRRCYASPSVSWILSLLLISAAPTRWCIIRPVLSLSSFRQDRAELLDIGGGDTGDDGSIVGGVTVVDIDEFPHYAINAGSGRCGASLIARNILITVAHCSSVFLVGQTMFIGITSLVPQPNNREAIKIAARLAHPFYDRRTFDNDVMLLRLESPSAAPLVSINTNTSIPAVGELVTAIGFGATSYLGALSSTLQKMSVPASTPEACSTAYNAQVANTTIKFCAGGGLVDSCNGDSGGPLLNGDGSTDLLVGLVSSGFKCAIEGFPGVYTRISGVLDFIQLGTCALLQDDVEGLNALPWQCPSRAPTTSPAPSISPAPSSAPTLSPTPAPQELHTPVLYEDDYRCSDERGNEGEILAWDLFGLFCWDVGCVTSSLFRLLLRALLARNGRCTDTSVLEML